MINAVEVATSYVARGWTPIPVPYMKKRPTVKNWQRCVITSENVPQYFSGQQLNIGVVLGRSSQGLTDIDLDCPEAIAIAPFVLPRTGAIFGRPSARAAHWLYRSDLSQPPEDADDNTETDLDNRAVLKLVDTYRTRQRTGEKATLVELRIGGSKGAQTIFPGSVHETGEPITWEEAGEPTQVDGIDLVSKVKLIAVGALLIRYWPGLGAKHDAALAVGGFFARAGYKPEWIKYFVERIAREAGCVDVADKMKAAFDSATNTLAGKKTWGLRTIKDLFGDHVAEKVSEWLDYSGDYSDYAEVGAGADAPKQIRWSAPIPLPVGLKAVAPFDSAFLPASIAPWVADISDRMQCPPDFVGVSAIVALGSVLGCRVGVRPQRQTNWIEVANLWGCIIGRPGAMKSPAMAEALKPLHRLEADARKKNEHAAQQFAAEKEAFEIRKQVAQKKAKDALGKGSDDIAAMLRLQAPEEPKARRFVVNDCTYEALGEILSANVNGVLANRDELVSLLKTLDREEQAAARGFFLTAWNGTSGYAFDRIIRGRTYVERACLSLLGSTQPGKISEYIRHAISGGAHDDGLIQRFGLLVWPDQSPAWKEVDRNPDSAARQAAWETFDRLNEVTPGSVQAETDQYETISYLRFDSSAHGLFAEWREGLEQRLRSSSLHAAIESHLAKYRKLVPALALINHLADGGVASISELATLRAISFAEYLETHARRAYAAGSEAETSAATAILGHIRKGDLTDGFTARDIHRRDWSSLTDRGQIQAGLDLLAECDWVAGEVTRTPGRSKTVYRINPGVARG